MGVITFNKKWRKVLVMSSSFCFFGSANNGEIEDHIRIKNSIEKWIWCLYCIHVFYMPCNAIWCRVVDHHETCRKGSI